jgi:hypothetical protein
MGECTHMVDTGLTAGMTPSLSLRDEAPLPALRVTFSRGTGEGEMGEMVLAPTGGGVRAARARSRLRRIIRGHAPNDPVNVLSSLRAALLHVNPRQPLQRFKLRGLRPRRPQIG